MLNKKSVFYLEEVFLAMLAEILPVPEDFSRCCQRSRPFIINLLNVSRFTPTQNKI